MKSPVFTTLISVLSLSAAISEEVEIRSSPAQEKAAIALKAKLEQAEKTEAGAIVGFDGWLFLASELRFLTSSRFWGEDALKVTRSPKPEAADPLLAIVDFHRQLKARGIDLLLVPVRAKAAIYPEQLVPGVAADALQLETLDPFVPAFYTLLKKEGVEVLDLTASFVKERASQHGPVFCKTDTHWSGAGCVLAAQAVAEKVKSMAWLKDIARKEYVTEWNDLSVEGDLVSLLPPGATKPGNETIQVRKVVEKSGGARVQADPASPVLLMGDSHTLVFHEFLAENAGMLDQLAAELGFSADLIGTRGSGATPVRISLYRQSAKDPGYLAAKKLVIWCFAVREFTEAAQGWPKLPIAK